MKKPNKNYTEALYEIDIRDVALDYTNKIYSYEHFSVALDNPL